MKAPERGEVAGSGRSRDRRLQQEHIKRFICVVLANKAIRNPDHELQANSGGHNRALHLQQDGARLGCGERALERAGLASLC